MQLAARCYFWSLYLPISPLFLRPSELLGVGGMGSSPSMLIWIELGRALVLCTSRRSVCRHSFSKCSAGAAWDGGKATAKAAWHVPKWQRTISNAFLLHMHVSGAFQSWQIWAEKICLKNKNKISWWFCGNSLIFVSLTSFSLITQKTRFYNQSHHVDESAFSHFYRGWLRRWQNHCNHDPVQGY